MSAERPVRDRSGHRSVPGSPPRPVCVCMIAAARSSCRCCSRRAPRPRRSRHSAARCPVGRGGRVVGGPGSAAAARERPAERGTARHAGRPRHGRRQPRPVLHPRAAHPRLRARLGGAARAVHRRRPDGREHGVPGLGPRHDRAEGVQLPLRPRGPARRPGRRGGRGEPGQQPQRRLRPGRPARLGGAAARQRHRPGRGRGEPAGGVDAGRRRARRVADRGAGVRRGRPGGRLARGPEPPGHGQRRRHRGDGGGRPRRGRGGGPGVRHRPLGRRARHAAPRATTSPGPTR